MSKKHLIISKSQLCLLFLKVHDMEFAPSLDIIINETLPALQKVQQSGKARFIGITGYPLENFRYKTPCFSLFSFSVFLCLYLKKILFLQNYFKTGKLFLKLHLLFLNYNLALFVSKKRKEIKH